MPLVEAELREFHLPDITTAAQDLTARELFASTSASSKLVFARFKHEHDHLVRLLSTSVGLFSHQLDSQLPDQFRWIASQAPEDRFSVVRPLVTDEDLSDRELSSAATERHAAVRLWYRTESLRRALFDTPSETEFVQALTMLSQFREGQSTIEVDAVWPPTPVYGSTGLSITGRNIVEFFAVLAEMDASALLADGEHPWQSLLQDADYNAVMLLWHGAFPSGSLWDVDRNGRLEADFRLIVRWAYPMELYACLDIALWPPLVPTGVYPSDTRSTWKDIHPGYRFVRLCEWLQGANVPLTRIGGEDRNARFHNFQETACNALGWPSISELSAIWRQDNQCKMLGEPRQTSNLMGISLEQPGHSRLSMIDRLFRARAESPCDFVLGNRSAIELGVGHLGLITPGVGGLAIGESPGMSWDLSPAIIRSVMVTSRFLLGGVRCSGDHPEYFRQEHVDSALLVLRRILPENGERFEPWARALLNK